MSIDEAKNLTWLISRIDDGNHCLMENACADAANLFPEWGFEVVRSDKYEWCYKVKLSMVTDGVSIWDIDSEEINDSKNENNSISRQKI